MTPQEQANVAEAATLAARERPCLRALEYLRGRFIDPPFGELFSCCTGGDLMRAIERTVGLARFEGRWPTKVRDDEPILLAQYRDSRARLWKVRCRRIGIPKSKWVDLPGADSSVGYPFGWHFVGVARSAGQRIKTLVICEGEADTAAGWVMLRDYYGTDGPTCCYELASLGVVVLGLPGASTAWRSAWSDELRSIGVGQVVIVRDNDDAGARMAARIAPILGAVARGGVKVSVPKSDLADALAEKKGGVRRRCERPLSAPKEERLSRR